MLGNLLPVFVLTELYLRTILAAVQDMSLRDPEYTLFFKADKIDCKCVPS
jgi:hypothetical protein